ncbi:MAG: S8 family peptidase [Acidimicrobiales bacterium]
MSRVNARGSAGVAVAVALGAVLFGQPVASAQPTSPPGGAQETVIAVLDAACSGQSAPAGTCPSQAPIVAQLQAEGATVLSTTTLVDTVTAEVTQAQAQALAAQPGVAQVVPDSVIPLSPPNPSTQAAPTGQFPPGAPGWRAHGPGGQVACGPYWHPELDPEALQVIDAPEAQAEGFDGAGVTVAFVADGLDTADPDFRRNPAYASQGGAGQDVITDYEDFSGDGVDAVTAGGEAFGDASSIAAQGNTAYNLADFVAPAQAARLPAGGCWVKIVGAAPGADLMALKAFAQNDDTTESGLLQAIQYAVQHGAKVLNESFGANNFPDTALDVVRDANDAAIAAGVTVVVSSGDAGVTSTIGSPASDPEVLSVGASTTFRAYAQSDEGGFYNPVVGNGRWADDNISSLSSGGFTQAGNTVDLVAPGDLNWALCSSTPPGMYRGCTNDVGAPSDIELFGGTSESAPLTAAAAADVIQAYAATHGGADPTPALVKQILMSSAKDLDAPATEQGAGLLDIASAVNLATSLPGATRTGPPHCRGHRGDDRGHGRCHGRGAGAGRGGGPSHQESGGLLVAPGQVNVVAPPNSPYSQQISLTNTGTRWARVGLSTRALTRQVYDSGAQTFTMDPANPTTNTGTFQIWSGVTEVYQSESFQVPWSGRGTNTRLVFSADYRYTGQNSVLHFALFEPDGTYAAYSLPQGFGDYGQVEVADPPPGTWTALFFTVQDGATPGAVGTSGPVQWDAGLWQYAPAGAVSPSQLEIGPGQTATATLSSSTPSSPGDTSQSVVVTSDGAQTTVPVTVRTTVALGAAGGTFSGVLSGGNGRAGAEAQTNTYFFDVPAGLRDLDASVALANDPFDELIAYLVNPDGQTVGYSSNYTLGPTSNGLAPATSPYLQIYHSAPDPGRWELVLYWANPVTGDELTEPFTGTVGFDQVDVTGNLPNSPSDTLPQLTSTAFDVKVTNTGVAPEAFFADPRLDQTATVALANQNPAVTATSFTMPLPAGLSFPYYLVPTHTSELSASVDRLSGAAPVTFDMEYFPGDPDVSPGQPAPNVTETSTATSATLDLAETPEVSPGLWLVNPDEQGPYPPGGALTDTASTVVSATTQAFDPAVTSDTDDFWQVGFAASSFLYLLPGQSGTIAVDITPTASPGSVVGGTLYVDDIVLASFFSSDALPDGDELAGIPYSYTVGAPPSSKGPSMSTGPPG